MRYLKYLIVFSCSSFVILYLLYRLYIIGYNKYYSYEYKHINEIVNGRTANDILFIGSSRTVHHINPKLIDSITGMGSYNAGVDGANLLEMSLILKSYLNSHPPPQILFIDLAISSFAIDSLPFRDPNLYYQHLNNQIIYKGLKPYKRVFLFKYLPFTLFTEANDLLKQNSIRGYIGESDPLTKKSYKGFVDYGPDTLALPLKKRYRINYPIEKKGKALLQEMVSICKKKNIQPIFTYAPEYQPEEKDYNPKLFPTIKEISSSYNIPFVDFRTERVFENHRLFKNEHHLNHYGVEIYSAMIANEIKISLKATPTLEVSLKSSN